MKHRYTWKSFVIVQVVFVVGVGLAFWLADAQAYTLMRQELPGQEAFRPVPVERTTPIQISRPYNRPDLVSDEDLAAVLKQIQPTFDRKQMKSNFVEHALRAWGVDATFQNPKVLSGQEMLGFLTDNAKFVESWGREVGPILQARPHGIGIHWGTDLCASYHHDHLLACVTEAGAPLTTPVYAPTRRGTLYDVLQESLRDFRLDERETEWTAMAFGLWIPPEKTWIGGEGRQYSFDLVATRLMRGEKTMGVCAGTHRVYSLMLLIRLDDQFHILSENSRQIVYSYLESVRDAITHSQFEDGSWPTNWPDGKAAVEKPLDEPEYKRVIATGHHLEWMSIAPQDLLIPEPQLKKAMDWVIANTKKKTKAELKQTFTFYTHVGAALCNWRQVRAADFWRDWESKHPYDPSQDVEEAAPAESPAPAAH
jgi:hypothetical protein